MIGRPTAAREGYAEMGSTPEFFLLAVVFAAFARLAAASSFISGCPVDFEFMNYTSITGRCQGPKYPADQCCRAFRDFACPYASELNDLTNDCASIMLSYINLYGKYPPGLFASECREGKEGLECTHSAPQSQNDSSSCPGQMNQCLVCVVFVSCASVLGFLFS